MLMRSLWIAPWLFVLTVWLRIGAGHSRNINHVIRGFGLWTTSSSLTSWEGRKSWRLSLITWAIIQWSCLHNETLIKSWTLMPTWASLVNDPLCILLLISVLWGDSAWLHRNRALEASLCECGEGEWTFQTIPTCLFFLFAGPDLYPFLM